MLSGCRFLLQDCLGWVSPGQPLRFPKAPFPQPPAKTPQPPWTTTSTGDLPQPRTTSLTMMAWQNSVSNPFERGNMLRNQTYCATCKVVYPPAEHQESSPLWKEGGLNAVTCALHLDKSLTWSSWKWHKLATDSDDPYSVIPLRPVPDE